MGQGTKRPPRPGDKTPKPRPYQRVVPEFTVRDCRAEAVVARSAFLAVSRLSVGELRRRAEETKGQADGVSFWEAAALSLVGKILAGDARALEAFAKIATADGLFRQVASYEVAIVESLSALREILRNSSTSAREIAAWYAEAAARVGNEPDAIATLERAAKTAAEVLRLQPEALASASKAVVFDFTGWAPPRLPANEEEGE